MPNETYTAAQTSVTPYTPSSSTVPSSPQAAQAQISCAPAGRPAFIPRKPDPTSPLTSELQAWVAENADFDDRLARCQAQTRQLLSEGCKWLGQANPSVRLSPQPDYTDYSRARLLRQLGDGLAADVEASAMTCASSRASPTRGEQATDSHSDARSPRPAQSQTPSSGPSNTPRTQDIAATRVRNQREKLKPFGGFQRLFTAKLELRW